ncbi:hypothetical protein GCM10007857_90180 [Bradyrhizobium iriomotense]|uniref:Transposase n=1 Tax=Bradyrhizobium iriomotense TaxID=441950 RepID=A0ABQ6BD29_9BRAD|nr:hypothetical protein GCM10007857_90180 [Bradyrhizobium iriomotense]
MQDAAITIEMQDRAFAGAAVFEAISHHRRTAAAKRSVIPGISPSVDAPPDASGF